MRPFDLSRNGTTGRCGFVMPLVIVSMFAMVLPAIAQEWEKVLAEATRERKVVVAVPPGAPWRSLMLGFAREYPEIGMEVSAIRSDSFAPRVIAERKAGQKLWDVFVGGIPGSASLKSTNAVVPLRPALILPEVKGNQYWHGGVDFGFMDVEKSYIYGFIGLLAIPIYANRTTIPTPQLTSPRDIISPRFKGKIVIEDPRGFGAGSARLAGLLTAYGEDFIRRLLTEQEPVLTRDPRQVVEWLIRGRYPIGIGIRETILKDFRDRGLGKDVEPVTAPEAVVYNTSGGNVSLLEGTPHPNATRVFINWLLSKRGQELMAELLLQNSRRTDVNPADPDAFPDPKHLRQYTRNDEAWGPVQGTVAEIARSLIK